MREAGAVTASGAYCRCAKVLDLADSLECAKLAPLRRPALTVVAQRFWIWRIRRVARGWRRYGVRRLLPLREGSGSGGFAGMREAGAVTASGAYCRCAKVLDLADSTECARLAP